MSEVKPQVKLAHFNAQEETAKIYEAAYQCHSPLGGDDLYTKCSSVKPEAQVKLIKRVLDEGHLSVAEHMGFQFQVGYISRACSHQAVRHRETSPSQNSQRNIVSEEDFPFIVPPEIKMNAEAFEVYLDTMAYVGRAYVRLINLNIHPENARYVLVNAAATSIVVSMNLRELIHICHERLCMTAQWEIRRIVMMMYTKVVSQLPWLAPYLVPKCKHYGFCREKNSCGLMPKKEEKHD